MSERPDPRDSIIMGFPERQDSICVDKKPSVRLNICCLPRHQSEQNDVMRWSGLVVWRHDHTNHMVYQTDSRQGIYLSLHSVSSTQPFFIKMDSCARHFVFIDSEWSESHLDSVQKQLCNKVHPQRPLGQTRLTGICDTGTDQ